MASPPLFSIVIPSFNQAPFLEECLQSVLNQSGVRLEILLMDGGSTDGSVEIIRRFADRITFWKSSKDRGQADAVNQGWARSKGDILGWLNSDDRYAPGALTFVAEAYVRNPQAALIYGDIAEIRADGSAAGIKRMAGFSLRSLLLGKNMGQPGVFITRNAFTAVGGLDDTLHFALDFEYFLRIWSRYRPEGCVYVPEALADSRLWAGTKSAAQADKFGAEYKLVLDHFFACADLPTALRALKRQAYSRSVYLRQARLCLDAGDWRRGVPALARAMWVEGSPWQAARMAHLAVNTWRGRG
jgi:glycosyltransferase involved in cell wall biosynthesis